jgi:RNA polymerase sigma factor (sigma-70 family)
MEMNDLEYNKAYESALSDIQGLAWRWYKNKYIQSDNMLDKDDIEQEITIAFFSALETYKDEGYTFRTYYNRVIFNHMSNYVRAIKVRCPDYIVLEGLESVDDLLTAPNTISSADKMRDILSVLDVHLSDRDYSVVVLYYGLGLPSACSMQDIANITGVPPSTTSRIIKKALEHPDIQNELEYLN